MFYRVKLDVPSNHRIRQPPPCPDTQNMKPHKLKAQLKVLNNQTRHRAEKDRQFKAEADRLRKLRRRHASGAPDLSAWMESMAARAESADRGDGTYKSFLRSPYWNMVRAMVSKRDSGLCQQCARKGRDVHHLSYRHHFKEHVHLEDLVLLCRKCHDSKHR